MTYQNSSFGIRIQYPANWTKDEQDFDANDAATNIVAFISPLTSRFDIYPENLGISMERLTDQSITLDEYATSLITDYNKTLTDFNLIELNTNITLGGGNNPAYRLIYTDREDNINYKTMEIGTIIGDKVYYIEYIAEEKQYSNYLPTIQSDDQFTSNNIAVMLKSPPPSFIKSKNFVIEILLNSKDRW